MARLLLFLIAAATPAKDREWVVGDTIEELEHLQEKHGHRAAQRWLRGEAWRVLCDAPRHHFAASQWANRSVSHSGDGHVKPLAPDLLHGEAHDMAIPRSQRFLAALDVLAQDLRYASRTLRRAPSFSLTVIATLAFGIGATTGVYSLINGLLLRELPVKEPHRLVTVSSQAAMAQGRLAGSGWSHPMWERFRERGQAFGGAFAWMPQRFNLGSGGEMRVTEGIVTTSDLFDTLGVPAALGRTFTTDDDRRGGGSDGPVAVISHAFWTRRLNGTGDVIGSPLVIEGVPFSIAGVTPPSFTGVEVGRSFDVAITFGAEALLRSGAAIEQPNAFSLIPMLRLKPAQTIEAATNVIRDLQPGIVGTGRMPPFVQEPFLLVPAPTGTSAAGPGMAGLRQQYERPLLIVLIIVCVLHVIACTNIANLLLVRASSRRAELGIRMALGASRSRLASQLLIESLTLSIVGAIGAALVAGWTTKALVAQLTAIDPAVSLSFPIDWRVVGFGTAATMISVALFGAVPAFRASAGVQHRRGWGGPSHGLVVIQVALSLVLLVASGLLVRTVSHLAAVPLGFDRDNVLLVTVETKGASIAGSRLSLYERLVSSVSAVPGVESAAASTSIPLSGGYGRLRAGTSTTTPDAKVVTLFNHVSPNWFATYGTLLSSGRDFNESDSATAPPVVIINEALARALFKGGDPIGDRLVTGAPNWPPQTVIGVVRDAVYHSVGAAAQSGAALRDPVAPTMYIPLAQSAGLTPPGATRITIGVRSIAGAPARLATSVGASLVSVDPNVSFSARPLADVVRAAFAQEQLVAVLSSAFGALALFLVAVGVYGVTSYAVSQRRMEVGIRIALGATRRSVVRLLLRRVAIVTGLGMIAGIVLAVWELQVISSFLFGVSAHDPVTMLAAVLTVSVMGLAAGWLPAWRAARVEPIRVLREN